MSTCPNTERRAFALAFVATLLCGGCLPIPRTATLSPPVVGTVVLQDGTPLPDRDLVLSVAHADSVCRTPALATRTDSAGRFDFPPVRQRESFTPVLFDRLLCYRVCSGQGGDPLHHACFLHAVPPADTLRCVEATEPGDGSVARTRCSSRPRPRP